MTYGKRQTVNRNIIKRWAAYVPGREISRGEQQRGSEYDISVHGRGSPQGGGGGQGQLGIVGPDERGKARERGERDQFDGRQGGRYGGHAAAHGGPPSAGAGQQLSGGGAVADRGVNGALQAQGGYENGVRRPQPVRGDDARQHHDVGRDGRGRQRQVGRGQ